MNYVQRWSGIIQFDQNLPAAAAETFPLNAIAAMLVKINVTDPSISIRNINHRFP